LLHYRLDLAVFAALSLAGVVAVHAWLCGARRSPGVRPMPWARVVLVIVAAGALAEYSAYREWQHARSTRAAFEGESTDHLLAHIQAQRAIVLGNALLLVAILLSSAVANSRLGDEVLRRRDAEQALRVQKALLESQSEASIDGILVVSATGRVVSSNRRFAVLWGISDEVAATTSDERLLQDIRDKLTDPESYFARVAQLYDQPLEVSRDLIGLRDGRYFDRYSAPVLGKDGTYFGRVWFFRDVTDSMRTEVALRHSEERFRLAAQCASDFIFEWDIRTGRVTWFGDIDQHLGYKQGELSQTLEGSFQLIHPDDRGRFRAALERCALHGGTFREKFRGLCADGTVRYMADCGLVTRDDAGEPLVMIGAVTDLTLERQAQALETERGALRQSVASMEQVLGVVAHELRTPLAGVRAMTDLLLQKEARESGQFDHFLEAVNKEVIHMADTVNDLLEAARLNSGRAQWNWTPFDVSRACRDALDRIRPLVDPAKVALECEAPDGMTAHGDADAVGRLVLNLLSNAARHTAGGSIRVSAKPVDGGESKWVEVEVTDSGAGIPPKILERLGQAFALNAGIVGVNHVSGAGLGLAICNGIAAAHGGDIRFQSQQGSGTRVTVRLRADLPGPVPALGPEASSSPGDRSEAA
jgi:PAS domain S-box-containing protein